MRAAPSLGKGIGADSRSHRSRRRELREWHFSARPVSKMRGIHDSLLRLTALFPALPSQGARNPAPPATSRRSAVSGTVSRPIVNAPTGAVITPACHVAQSLRGFSTLRRTARVLKGPPPPPISNFLSYCHRPAAATTAFHRVDPLPSS